jgi:hypothetical protein
MLHYENPSPLNDLELCTSWSVMADFFFLYGWTILESDVKQWIFIQFNMFYGMETEFKMEHGLVISANTLQLQINEYHKPKVLIGTTKRNQRISVNIDRSDVVQNETFCTKICVRKSIQKLGMKQKCFVFRYLILISLFIQLYSLINNNNNNNDKKNEILNLVYIQKESLLKFTY